jgi:hypothetical protein
LIIASSESLVRIQRQWPFGLEALETGDPATLTTHDQRDGITTIRSKTVGHAGIFTGKPGR